MGQVCLLCVVHDPNGRYVSYLQQARPVLEAIYPHRYVAVSDRTSQVTLSVLHNAGWRVQVVPKAGAANARRDVLRIGQQTEYAHFHYCDLDRILTWTLNYPEELAEVKESIMGYDFVVFGRTDTAFVTHPESWQATEKIANHICSLELGQFMDVTAGSCGMSRTALDYILTHSKAKVTDAEWPMIVRRIAHGRMGYQAVEGLMYVENINGPIGDQASAETWLARLRLSHLIGESAVITGKDS